MGCDGGSIPKRKEIVKKKKEEKRDPECALIEKWGYCAASDYPLRKPIVSTHMGDLLNKEGAIQHLLEYKRGDLQAYHRVEDVRGLGNLHSMKDMKELNLKEIDKTDQERASTSKDTEIIWWKYCCPITDLPMNGKYKFVFSWQCGCVVSERAFNEMSKEKKCIVCQQPYREEQIVVINPTDAKDLKRNETHMAVRFVHRYASKHGLLSSQQGPDGPSTSSSGANRTPSSGPSTSSSASNSSSKKKSRSGQPETSPTKRSKPDEPRQSKK